jgi:DNA-binding MarR family transcriptional regulator
VSEDPSETIAFGDQLALARMAWIEECAQRLKSRGFDDYRRSDAFVVRLLARRSSPLGELADTLAITRQGARKIVDALVARGYANVERDEHDARRLVIALTNRGRRYARAILAVIDEMNSEVHEAVAARDFVATTRVLQTLDAMFGSRDKALRSATNL